MATVLVVDDVAANRDVVSTLLGHRGHRVLEAGEGHEALATARREHPDVIVTDVLMPGMDGYELARALRADPDTVKAALIFHSANYSEDELQLLQRTCGVNRIVQKSADPRLLLDAVEAVLTESPSESRDLPGVDDDLQHVHIVNAKLIDKIRELSTSEAQFRAMAQSSPVGIFLVDRRGGTSYVNERLQTIMGSVDGALLGHGWLRCFSPGLR
jgi:CheY-like chemotaxis protein